MRSKRTLHGYDSHGRQSTATDARNGTTTYCFNNADQVNGIVTPQSASGQAAQVTTNFFDNMGRVFATTLPDGTSVTNRFNPTGLTQLTYGSRTYPVGYSYDAQGRIKTMTNWSSFTTQSGARVTTWNYDIWRGWLTNKTYDGGTAGPKYTYTPAGRLATRLWVRGTNTTYAYNNAGDLASVSYNDGATATTSYGFDRRGRQNAVTNGTLICSLTLNDAGQTTTEAYTAGLLNGVSVTNGYDTLLRRTNLTLLYNNSVLARTTNNFDAAGRLQTVSDGVNSATYTYLANSPLVSQIDFKNSGTVRMSTTKAYDALNRLTNVVSSTNSVAVAGFAYSYNSANQRTAVTREDGSYWVYTYDSLGQVISGKKYWGDGTPVAGQQFEYAFDQIGNRSSTKAGGDQWGANLRYATYAANNLNQYTSRTVPGALDVVGSAKTNATVTVNNQTTYRKADFFRAQITTNNASGAAWLALTNQAVLNNGSNPDITVTNTGNAFLPQTPESFFYDADGNLTQDGRWQYTWDAENRLVTIQALSGLPTAAKYKLDLTYDAQGRRIQKLVSTNNGSVYVAQYTNRFAYDGWNLFAMLNPQSSMLQSFLWGLDLSGTMQGAGGVGGLLAVNDSANGVQFAVFDGNGNVSALTKATDGTTSARYQYGPFGELLRATGPMAKANPFRFSTKYQDDETDLLYYGYRYYYASTGRWTNKDPIEEEGGLNLYAFPLNAPVNGVDYLGRAQLSYNTLSKEPGKCGGFTWKVEWKVNQPVEGASVVQSMKWTFSPVPCPENWGIPPIWIAAGYAMESRSGLLSPYWEAWPTVTAFNGTFGTDTWFQPDYPFGDGTFGAIGVTGSASYYPNVTYNSILNNPIWSNWHPPGSGPSILAYTTTDPHLAGDTGFVKRTLIATWNCCCWSKDKSTKLKIIE